MNMNSVFNIFSYIISIAGILSIAISIFLRKKSTNLIKKCTSSCKGVLTTIVEREKEYSNSSNDYQKIKGYFPVYEFEVNEKKYSISDTTGTTRPEDIKIGTVVKINYNPQNPEECYKKGDYFSKAWLIFLIVGIICIIEAVVVIFIKVVFN